MWHKTLISKNFDEGLCTYIYYEFFWLMFAFDEKLLFEVENILMNGQFSLNLSTHCYQKVVLHGKYIVFLIV